VLIFLFFFAKNFILLDHLDPEKIEKSALFPPHAWSILWRHGW